MFGYGYDLDWILRSVWYIDPLPPDCVHHTYVLVAFVLASQMFMSKDLFLYSGSKQNTQAC